MKKIKTTLIAGSFALVCGLLLVSFKGDKQNFDVAKNMSIFNALVRQLRTYYVEDFDADEVVTAGIDAMLDELDPYTVYYPADDNEELEMMTTGKYAGVGAIIRFHKKKDYCVIQEPYEDMPALNTGLRAGDVLVQIDTTQLKGLPVDKVSNLLRGEAGTTVTVVARRPGESEPRTFKVVREAIQLPAVPYYGMVNDSTGYIVFERFIENCSRDVRLAIIDLKERGATNLVLDLRGNGGGLLSEAVNIVNFFVPKGLTVVETRGKLAQASSTYKTQKNPYDADIPLVVLVDGNTASAAEILSGALQDLDRAVVVGNRTYGKGLVQVPLDLPYGATLKVTSSKYYIPSGRCIQAIDYAQRDDDGYVTRIPDSLTTVFHTAGGREVRDGCGISPDVEVKSEKVSNLLFYIDADETLFDFATAFVRQHDTIAPAAEFTVSDELYAAFCDSLKAHDFTYDRGSERALKTLRDLAKFEGYMEGAEAEFDALEAKLTHNLDLELATWKDDVKMLLADEIVKRYYYQKGSVEQALKSDDGLKLAVEILGDKPRYHDILSPRP